MMMCTTTQAHFVDIGQTQAIAILFAKTVVINAQNMNFQVMVNAWKKGVIVKNGKIVKSLNNHILTNLLNELNICKAKRSILLNSGLVPSILESRIEYLEREIVKQRKKCQHSD